MDGQQTKELIKDKMKDLRALTEEPNYGKASELLDEIDTLVDKLVKNDEV
jgi:hypothetical protein